MLNPRGKGRERVQGRLMKVTQAKEKMTGQVSEARSPPDVHEASNDVRRAMEEGNLGKGVASNGAAWP